MRSSDTKPTFFFVCFYFHRFHIRGSGSWNFYAEHQFVSTSIGAVFVLRGRVRAAVTTVKSFRTNVMIMDLVIYGEI